MVKFPFICGIIWKKLYLTILLTLIYILQSVHPNLIPKGNDISLINNLGGSIVQMLSRFIPYVFKFKGKSQSSSKISAKGILKDYFLLFLIILSSYGITRFFQYLNIKSGSINLLWVCNVWKWYAIFLYLS